MPLLKENNKEIPAWCEMTHYEIVYLAPGEQHTFARRGKKERLFVCEGQCRIRHEQSELLAERSLQLDLTSATPALASTQFEVTQVLSPSILIRVCGHWGEELGGSGLFTVVNSDEPSDQRVDKGDPVDYPKATNFDNHYHDYDEYWIFYRGRCLAVSEGKHFEVGPGDCVATGMGHHHDFANIYERVEAIFFETTIGGQKRRGHLWNHTHGPAQPQADRI